jgi:hypothetical protein
MPSDKLLDRYKVLPPSTTPIRTKRKDTRHVYLLGVDDPEMIEIRSILKSQHAEIYYAMRDGERVHVGNAYECDPIEVPSGTTLVLIECEPVKIAHGVRVIRIDHHRPGDYGHGHPPKEYWERSSIGQLCKHLGITPSYRQRVIAALDHCMVHALKGKCPGVEPDDVKKMSKHFIARRKKVSEREVESCMMLMRQMMILAPLQQEGGQRIMDLTHVTWEIDSLEYLCARDILAELGHTAIIALKGLRGGLDKIVLYGDPTPASVKAFVAWAKSEQLVHIYSDAERGYAGGYIPRTYAVPAHRSAASVRR